MARRGLTSQQNNRENRVFVQPYPNLCPTLKSFTTVLSPKYPVANSPGTCNGSSVDEGDGQQGTNSRHSVAREEYRELQKRFTEMQKAHQEAVQQVDAMSKQSQLQKPSASIRVKKQMHERPWEYRNIVSAQNTRIQSTESIPMKIHALGEEHKRQRILIRRPQQQNHSFNTIGYRHVDP